MDWLRQFIGTVGFIRPQGAKQLGKYKVFCLAAISMDSEKIYHGLP
jgi:hypothetical protein